MFQVIETKLAGSLDNYHRILEAKDATDQLRTVNGVALAFSSDLHTDPDAATRRLEEQLSGTEDSKAVLLFSNRNRTMGRSRLLPTHERFWKLVENRHISVQLEPTRYGHALEYVNSLPSWNVGSNGWSTRGAITLVRVYKDRVDIAQVDDPMQPTFSLSVPNTRERAKDDARCR